MRKWKESGNGERETSSLSNSSFFLSFRLNLLHLSQVQKSQYMHYEEISLDQNRLQGSLTTCVGLRTTNIYFLHRTTND